MTISATTIRSGPYTGNGSTTVFAYGWLVNAKTELRVYLTDTTTLEDTLQTVDTHYSVSGVGSASGGNVTFSTAPATGKLVTIIREVASSQEVDLPQQGPWDPAVIEGALDKLTMQIQELREQLARCVRASVSNAVTIPTTETVAGYVSSCAAAVSTTAASQSAAAGSASAAAGSASTASGHATTATNAKIAAEAAQTAAAGSASTASGHATTATNAKIAAEAAQAAAEEAYSGATATPGANKVVKADSGGKIDNGWMSFTTYQYFRLDAPRFTTTYGFEMVNASGETKRVYLDANNVLQFGTAR